MICVLIPENSLLKRTFFGVTMLIENSGLMSANKLSNCFAAVE